MKPVEIEFLMRDKLSDGLNKAGQAATSLGDKVAQSADQVKAKITEQKAVIKQVEDDLKDLEKQYGKLAPGAAQAEMKAEIVACKKVLDEEKAALMGVEKEYEQTRSTGKRLSMQLREMQDAMAKMRLEGKATSPEYQKLAADAATLADTIGDLRTQTNILANDDAGLQGVMSGVSGLAGGFTVATGVMGVFASENEDLIKIQTKVQSVMAITMGLQQVMNALNKDSAFRLVTVARAKDMLTGANVRLATALGISNGAATALMATLTLGLSLVITGLVIAWNKYSDAQAKAAAKAAEMVDIEKNGRGEMIKARVEIDNTKRSLKEFTGTKEQEKSKVEELNRKYGETFGYYKTIAEWYDVLQEKGEDYIQMLFLQAKAQSLVNKAIEADEKVAQVKATPEDDVDGSMGWFKKMLLYSAQGESNGQIDAQKLIDQHNKEAKEAAIKAAEEEKQAYLDEATKLQDELIALKSKKKLGDYVPDPKDTKEKPTNNLAELEAKARLKIEEQNLSLRQEGYDKQRAQAKLEFEKEKQRIEKEEKDRLALYEKLKKAGVKVTPEQKQEISYQAGVQKVKAAQLYDKQLEDLDKKELKERQDNLKKLLEPYRNFAQQRLDIEKKAQDDITKLQEQTSAGRLKKIGDEMTAAFGSGNVDLLARPQIDAAKLVAAGWKDAGEGIATVFSSQYGIQDASGKQTEILVTPILPDGTVLSEKELQDYVDNVLNGADDLLAADTKGIVLSVGVDVDGSAGELLHEFQEKYYDLKNNTSENADTDGQIQEAIIQAEQVKKDNLEELDRVYAEKDVYFQALMSQLSSMTLDQLYDTLDKAEKALHESEKTNGKDSKDTAVARAKVAALKDEIKYVKAENETKAPDDAKKWKKNSTAIKRCKAEIDGMIGSMDGLDEGTKAALQTASNVAGGAIAMIDGIKTLSVSAGESISAVEKASVILAIVGAAIQIMTAIFSMGAQAEKRHQEALAEVSANKLAMQREYNLLLLQQNLLMKEAENIFGEQSIAKAARAVEVYREAIRQYKEELKGDAPQKKLTPLSLFSGGLAGYKKELAAYEKGIGALNNITIKTGHKKTGLFGWGKGKDIYSGVLDVYPDLIDGENRLNMERAKTIINTQTMSDENKNLLQNLIDLQEQADEAQQALKDYLTDTFGSLGDGMMDSIVDAIKTGNDAWQSFGDKGAEVLENLGRQIAYSLFFAGKFDQLQKQLEAAYGSGKSEEQIAKDAMNIMGDFYAGIGKDMDQAQEFMENWKAEAAKRGFNLWQKEDGDQQSGKSGTFQTMDQETGTELKGLFTSVQQHDANIDDNVQYVADELHQSTDYLREIAENTSGCNDKLKAIAQDIETIRRDGLKTQ
ncbi:hypothetical protein [Bacteroides ovatus]|uniref:hypothetical protein n=1 Tax=Bacteroides ovatus TaxID=28116 RepID=UPI0022DF52DD|nr:hypothetical protein [Bacteroides ovatus]